MVFEHTGDIGMKLASFFIAQELATAFRAKYKVNDKVCEGLRHDCDALSGLDKFLRMTYPGLQPGLSPCGPSALAGLKTAAISPQPSVVTPTPVPAIDSAGSAWCAGLP